MLCDAQIHFLSYDADVAQQRARVRADRVHVAAGLGDFGDHADDRGEVCSGGCCARGLFGAGGQGGAGADDCAGAGRDADCTRNPGADDADADAGSYRGADGAGHGWHTGFDARGLCCCGLLRLLLVLVHDPRGQDIHCARRAEQLQLVDNVGCEMSKCRLVENEGRAVAYERKRVSRSVRLVDNRCRAKQRCDRLDGDSNLLLGTKHTAIGRGHGVGHGARDWPNGHAAHHVLLVLGLFRHLNLAFALLPDTFLGLHPFLHPLLLGVLGLAFRLERVTPLLLLEQGAFLGIENPHGALALWVVLGDARDLEEGLVEGQVVTNRVLPSGLGIETEPLPLACDPVTHFAKRTTATGQVDERAMDYGCKRRSGLERRGANKRVAVQTENLLQRGTRSST
jgi:hypothetical protein